MADRNTALALADTDEAQARWNLYLKSISEGVSPTDAMQLHGMLWREVEYIVLSSPLESQRWREAKLLGMSSRFSLLDRDELFARLARGVSVEKALIEVRGSDAEVGELFELIEALPDWQERFDASQRARDLREEQGLLEIADDTSRDILDNGKGGQQGNTAAVLRSKLRWEARTWRLAKNNPERWGEQKATTNIQINVNHAEVLEAARTRDKVRDKGVTKAQLAGAVDAVFNPVEPAAVELAQVAADAQKHSNADELREQAVARLEERPEVAESQTAAPTEVENPFSCLEE